MPTVNQVHIDAALTNLAVAYRNPGYIADQLAPAVAVRKQFDRYFIFDPEREAFRSSNDRRAPGAETNEVDFSISTDTYHCDDHALLAIIPDEERDNADPPIQPGIDRTEFLRDKIDLNKEIELAGLLTSASVVTQNTTLSGDDQWSAALSDPLTAIEERKAEIIESVQVVPNTLVLPYEVYAKVRVHPAITQRALLASGGAVGPELLATLFDVDQVLVPRALKNTSAPGQSASMQFVWGKHALLCYVPPRPSFKTVGLALTFQWGGAAGSLGGHLVETWREDRRKADVIRVQRYYDQKVIAAGAGFLWRNAVA